MDKIGRFMSRSDRIINACWPALCANGDLPHLKDQAIAGGMCIEFASGIDNAAFSRGQLPAAMQDFADHAQRFFAWYSAAHEIDAQLRRGVAAPGRHHGVNLDTPAP